jgi:hypothetical protein
VRACFACSAPPGPARQRSTVNKHHKGPSRITCQRFQRCDTRRLRSRLLGDASPFGPSGCTASLGGSSFWALGSELLESGEGLTVEDSRGPRRALSTRREHRALSRLQEPQPKESSEVFLSFIPPKPKAELHWRLRFLGSGLHRQNWTRSRSHDSFGDASEHHML